MSKATEQIRSFMIGPDSSGGMGEASIVKDAIEEFSTYFDKQALEVQLLEMENALVNNSENKVEVVQGLFRDMHSLKGSSAMLNIGPMTHLLHNVEDVLGVVSNSALNITVVKRTDIFDFFLQVLDLIEKLLNVFQKDPDYILKNNREIFGFYVRIIVEARSIVENIDQYMEFSEMDENLF